MLFAFSSCSKQQTSKKDIIEENFDFAAKQLDYALKEMKIAIENESGQSIHERAINSWSELTSPRSLNPDSSLLMVPSKDWCSGFFPGELWYMYEYTKDEKWKKSAYRRTIILEREKFNDRTHDMGFKMYCSYGNGYRLTGDTTYRNVLIESARTLITRFNPKVGAIRSWDFGNWDFPVIIDNMLNLELLFWATHETGDSTFYHIAVSHAKTTLKNHFRADYSSYHLVDYDSKTGQVRQKNTHQGYNCESAWSRGQAWGLYGYVMCYRETGMTEFLEQAKHIANFIFTHPNLPKDLIPYWDYNAPDIPNEPRDASAATCTASALYELSKYDKENAEKYIKWADTIIENITRDYRVDLNTHKGFLLSHSTGAKILGCEIDVPLVYADYYFLEALLRKKNL
ncbi:MAG: glycoside hydrolase family 88 protein [Candidatus Azobacteroides sp.]|nr:glycoside hydrolase family 88 protein [Candidatus Azobacteroides sp.]